MISARNLALRRGTRVLFEDASFTLNRGDRIGITGANGAGKSSFFELMLGHLMPDQGEMDVARGLEIAHVAQETPALDLPAIEFVLDGDRGLRAIEADIEAAEISGDGMALAHHHEAYLQVGGYESRAKASRLLNGLGFAPGAELKKVSEFSGGWRVRLNVAQALMCRSDVLLLDEPTNHLDLDAVIWLQDWLSSYPGTLLLVSHDRDFLDDLATHILHIEHGRVQLHTGNYTAFETRRAEMLAQQQASYARQQRELQRIQSFVDRFRAQATKARQVQSRLKALDRMSLIAMAQADSEVAFSFEPPEKSPSPLLKLDEMTVGYGGKAIVNDITLTISPGDRIGLLGPNGAGKSTLIKLLAGVLTSESGERIAAQDLKIGYFAQHQLELLNPEQSALWHLQKLDPRGLERDLRNYLGGFGFKGERALEPIGPFSGGEKSRLVLAMLIRQRPNLLLLDEPTNHLDLPTRDALSWALQEYEGALVLVSHDRYLLRTVADTFVLVADGIVEPYQGDLDEYRQWLAARRQRQKQSDVSIPNAEPSSTPRQLSRQEEAEIRKRAKSLTTAMEKAERLMNQLTSDLQDVEASLAREAIYQPEFKTELDRLLLKRDDLAEKLQHAESAWMESSEALETLEP
jgi:ATP-binding cassette subfamily F protein 3